MMTTEQTKQVAEVLVGVIIKMDPTWMGSIQRRMAEGETYEQWRISFQRLGEIIPGFHTTLAKADAEPLLQAMWQLSREKAAGGNA